MPALMAALPRGRRATRRPMQRTRAPRQRSPRCRLCDQAGGSVPGPGSERPASTPVSQGQTVLVLPAGPPRRRRPTPAQALRDPCRDRRGRRGVVRRAGVGRVAARRPGGVRVLRRWRRHLHPWPRAVRSSREPYRRPPGSTGRPRTSPSTWRGRPWPGLGAIVGDRRGRRGRTDGQPLRGPGRPRVGRRRRPGRADRATS